MTVFTTLVSLIIFIFHIRGFGVAATNCRDKLREGIKEPTYELPLKSPPLHPKTHPDYDKKPISSSLLLPKCTSEHFRYGQWIPGAHHCGLKSTYSNRLCEHFADVCPPSNQHQHLHAQQSSYAFADYCWQPYDCVAEPFSIASFCTKLSHRSILIVGDSLSHEFYLALASQLNIPAKDLQHQHQPLDIHKGFICSDYSFSNRSRIGFLRNDHLTVLSSKEFKLYPYNTSISSSFSSSSALRSNKQLTKITHRDWATAIDDTNSYDILVLNKGAHVLTSASLEQKLTNNVIAVLQRFLQQDSAKRRVYFRTTAQGHPQGSAYASVKTNHNLPLYQQQQQLLSQVHDNSEDNNDFKDSSKLTSKTTKVAYKDPVWFTKEDARSPADAQLFFQEYHWGRIPRNTQLFSNVLKSQLLVPPSSSVTTNMKRKSKVVHNLNISDSNYNSESDSKGAYGSKVFDIIPAAHMSHDRPDSHRCVIHYYTDDDSSTAFHDRPVEKNSDQGHEGGVIGNSDHSHSHYKGHNSHSNSSSPEIDPEIAKAVRNRCMLESCDLLHHYLPSDVDNYVFVLHNILT